MPRRDDYDHEDDRDQGGYDDDRPRRDDRRHDERDQQYDDYEKSPRRDRPEAGRERVSLPAIFLMIVGGLGLGMAIVNIAVEVLGLGGPNPFADPNKANDPDAQAAENVGKVVGGILQVIWAIIVFFGGLQMKNLKSRGFVIFSCIWAMLPCNLCCLLGIPFGIWALVVVNDESVKRAFQTG
jgi:hypothetical protein